MMMNNHPFHLVDYSPWPLTASIGLMTSMIGMINMFNNKNTMLMMIGNLIIILTMYQWWRDICRESTFQGKHTSVVVKGLKLGMILFIISELFFFISIFWTFFHSSLSPSIELGMNWPPMNIIVFNPFNIPLLNTMILLTSGITMTWAHYSLMNNNHSQTSQSLFFTIMLGLYFSLLQMFEYMEAPFTIADSIYGSIFFLSTGFHGIHVIIGTIFIIINLIRHNKFHFSKNHHFGFEAAAWYWHFVDIIWLFLYLCIYWWGK
uniref:cytochrome c oxidase subunit III n=1 Tax=Brachytarsina amboinensis TaxID=3018683 RepID=UPI0023AAD870|nr:cytochrome c oxidase subunit III [Brachytarsina amboinensis]WCL18789.1 cytochrome c oxidase subunit 3 [Brachytarsina amboinensis]